mmetsp:Transcript_2483/g.4627  ORF Transcript_2483/g.4627 Transcript_2483/m.4627 type:complete len:200 (-) Transcript_2483:1956-2555(-)
MEVVGFVAPAGPGRRRRGGGWQSGLAVFDPRAAQIRLEDVEQIITVQEETQTSARGAKAARTHSCARRVEAPPVVNIVVTLVEVGGGVVFVLELGLVRNCHLRTKAANIRSLGTTSILGTVTRSMHGTICVHTLLVVGCVVVPGNAQLLAKIIIQVGEGGVGVHLELELDVPVIVDEDKGRLDVKRTKVYAPSNLDQVG